MNWWDEQDDQRRNAINAVLDSERGQLYLQHAHGERGFAAWLLVTDATCLRRFAVSIFDLADWTWRDAYDSDLKPRDALSDALTFDGLLITPADHEH